MSESVEAQVRRMADHAWAAGMLDAVGVFAAYPRKDVLGGYIIRVRVRARKVEGREIMDHLEAVLGGHVRFDGGWVEWQASGVGPAWTCWRPFVHISVARREGLNCSKSCAST